VNNNLNSLNLDLIILLSSPLEGEVAFQCEQRNANIRKAGEGYFNQYKFFTPHPFFWHSRMASLVSKNFPLPQGARGQGYELKNKGYL
jgi:hypothetical protein